MWGWIWVAALYVLGIGFFRWLGGIGAASDAIQRWAQNVSSVAERRPSYSSSRSMTTPRQR